MSVEPQFIALIERAHYGQEYKGGIPYKHHLHRVAHLVTHLITVNNERGNLDDIAKAALAHDVLEDTTLTEKELRAFCSPKTILWIKALTKDDAEDLPPRRKYIEQMLAADEEAHLIKLSDLFDNMMTASRRIKENGLDWTKGYFYPIIAEMHDTMKSVSFKRFATSGKQLQDMCVYAFEMLALEIERWSS